MQIDHKIKASVLPTVMVISVLMLLGVLLLISLMDSNIMLFSKKNREKRLRTNIESAFKLYCNYPEIIPPEEDNVSAQLYDDDPDSQVRISRKRWGLYELITVSSSEKKIYSSRIVGKEQATDNSKCILWYCDNSSVLTLTGNSNLKGNISIPRNGIIYGQMQSRFFEGEEVELHRITKSETEIPKPQDEIKSIVDDFFKMHNEVASIKQPEMIINNNFHDTPPIVIDMKSRDIIGTQIHGNIVLMGDEILFDSTSTVSHIIVIADKVIIGHGFKGSMQIFASDTITVERNAELRYPSGLYSRKYIEIEDKSQINGYIITTNETTEHLTYKQSRLAKVRGLLYVSGTAQLQGMISGVAILDHARYYSPHGYYNDLLHDATILENKNIAYPLWLNVSQKRKEVCRVE